MFRLLRLIVSTLVLCIVIWFAVSVPIGNYTLWGHIVRIARTKEARDLSDGAKSVAKDAASRVERDLKSAGQNPPGAK